MLLPLLTVLPVFALIFSGWLARRLNLLGAAATSELNRFVVYLALPALLFDVTATAKPEEIWQTGFILAFGIPAFLVFGVTVALRRLSGRPLPDSAIDGLATGYANTGYMGFPLVLAVFGHQGLALTLIASILTICLLFAVGIAVLETGLQGGSRGTALVGKVAGKLARNPIVLSPALGAFFPLTGVALPDVAAQYLKLLGGAASPCALVALGLFLAADHGLAPRGQNATAAVFIAAKLLVQPVLTYILAVWVLRLEPLTAHCAVLIAALPTGTGPFMLAEFYNREAALTARVVLVSTIVSLVTVTLYLALIT